ncbi:phosphodiesterase [Leptolyngbya ohadii]|uniref:phosphodiesterase n=1 Tax=Leptolyngbya ohadii TaxID=1962290 RepID=UPI000B59ADAD|nr:phosphodiesterase [Leptolyngbya ohadii]
MISTGLTIAQITDTHLFENCDQALKDVTTARSAAGGSALRSLQAVLERVRQRQPDILLLTGDLSQDETQESYEHLRKAIVPLGVPAYRIPGNHDCPELITSILSDAPFRSEKLLRWGGWQGILLNSRVEGKVGGELSPESLQELDEALRRYPDLPAFVALHHPVFDVGSAWMREIGLNNAEDFLAVIDRHPQVRLVLFGHIHQVFEQRRRGVTYLGSPSTCVQFKPHSETFAIDDEAPGFRMVRLWADGRFETAVERVPV